MHPPPTLEGYQVGVNVSPGKDPRVDFEKFRRDGFDHVRILFDPEKVDRNHLMASVNSATSSNLKVILNAQPTGRYKDLYFSDEMVRISFEEMWIGLAKSIKDPEVSFELMNEPAHRGWWEFQKLLIDKIRHNSKNTIIATGDNYSTIEDLIYKQPYNVKNVAYSFHFYSPMDFTHQGANWLKQFSAISNVRYPSENYGRSEISSKIDKIKAWSLTYRVRVICDEYGVTNKAVPVDAENYILDVSNTLNKAKIPRTLWQDGKTFPYRPTAARNPATSDDGY